MACHGDAGQGLTEEWRDAYGPVDRNSRQKGCSHLGCMVESRNFGFECPYHSSRYEPDGRLLRGPATEDLHRLRIEKSDYDNLHVFKI
jgi:Rieske Fe-S protein